MVKCTIIIPTYNRPVYLRRILGYYSEHGKGFDIIVADSSSDDNKKLNRDIISSVSRRNIQYLDNYSKEINVHHKAADVVTYVKTKYCVLCADDDFVTPDGIRQSVDFLEKNPDFAVAHGRYIGFYLRDDKKGNKQFYWEPVYSSESILFSDAKDRLNYHLSTFLQPTFYAVHRADFFRMIYREAERSATDPSLFGELLPSMLTIIYGKLKQLDVLYAVRDVDSIKCMAGPFLREAIEAGIYDEEYAKFRDCLATHLSKQSVLNIGESRKVVDDAMSAYLKKYFYPPKSKMGMAYITTRMGQTLDMLHLPGWLNRGIRKPYQELAKLRNIKRYSNDMPPSSKDYEDFNRIRRQVLSSSK